MIYATVNLSIGERTCVCDKIKKTIATIIGPKPANINPLCKNSLTYLFILNP